MAISTWVMEVKDKNSLNKMIEMVQKQELEEIFLCQIDQDDAVIPGFKKDDVIAIISIKGTTLKSSLSNLGRNALLDDLDDSLFEIDDEGAALKGVRYPESEEDELEMLNSLS
jgi:hypothetical protein